ncbi:ATP-binding protein [Nocardia vaccinii]|uniref:ATP-binding protein n=1 Tax=Nocardia vaccinii TaxID=1822 RepID=UPI000A8E560E|nr:ATP-binding protein [Nocardia vaccinii]
MSDMSRVELFAAIRQDLRAGLSKRAIARKYRVGWHTVTMATQSVWPEPRKKYPHRPQKLDPYKSIIDDVLRADLDATGSQRHTATQIYHRLVEERGMSGVSYQRVSAYVRERKPQLQAEQAATRRRDDRLIRAAGFPRLKTLREFDFEADPSVDQARIHALAECEWVREGLPLCVIGGSGTGKSHLLIALGTEAAKAGYRVRYTLAATLVGKLLEARDGKRLANAVARYSGVDLLCIDELGYTELGSRGAELLFQVLTERGGGQSVAIAADRGFSDWSTIFTDAKLRAAVIERLTLGGTIVETGTHSYSRARPHASPPEP